MPKFFYKAIDKSGKVFQGYFDGDLEDDVLSFIDSQGLIPISVNPASSINLKDLTSKFNRIAKKELVLFSTQLGTMLRAGLPLTRSLRAIMAQVKNKKFKLALEEITNAIERGRTFYNSLALFPEFFDEIYVATIQIGEISGNLPDILFKLAENLEKEEDLRSKIKNATLYPKMVIGAIVIAIIILIAFVIPRFADLYRGFKTELPLPTRILIALSGYFATYWYVLVLIFSGLVILYLLLKNTKRGREIYDPLILKIPIIGDISVKIIMVRFSRFFSLLFSSGVVVTNILDLLQKVMGNVLYEKKISNIKNDILSGQSLGEAISRTGIFTPLTLEMINVGEETGSLDEMLKKVSEFYESELDYTIKNLTSMIEPILLIFIFAMVLFLALSVFLPMWDMVKFVGK
ncbi:MAG: type II secretion system F family protein [Proteobacteria bacterium]|nr:type II secretion system F family protein [Pseudomonadota bacterium]